MKNDIDAEMCRFFDVCPETARRETRSARVWGQPPIPDGDYAFIDFYCVDPDCDCRRAVIQVHSDDRIVGTFNYGWESRDFYAKWMGHNEVTDLLVGVTIEPSGPQSPYSHRLLALFESLLEDPEYASRFPRHYREFKNALRAKPHVRSRQNELISRRRNRRFAR